MTEDDKVPDDSQRGDDDADGRADERKLRVERLLFRDLAFATF